MLSRITKVVPAGIREEVRLFRMYRSIRKARSQTIPDDTGDDRLRISLCITCRDRLHHLRYSLPQNLNDIRYYRNAEIVVIDYGSKQSLDSWVLSRFRREVKTGVLKYARVLNVKTWNISHAKNIAHNLGTGDVLVNVDADNFVGAGFCEYINNIFANSSRPLVAQGSGRLDCSGRIAVGRENFRNHGGYDEQLLTKGWGYDDYDFVRRLQSSGSLLHKITNPGYLQAFWHSDEERTANYTQDIQDISKESHDNYIRSSKNIEAGLFVANQGQGWGRARIIYGEEGSEVEISEKKVFQRKS